MKSGSFFFLLPFLFLLSGCGALTGLPGHGGGKRFAVEQELVAAATRAAIKQIDLAAIKGKKVTLFVNAIGDTGNGNMVGGRFSVISQLRGDYLQSPVTTERSQFPRYTSTSSANSTTSTQSSSSSDGTSSSGGVTSTSDTNSGTSTVSQSSETSTTDTLLPTPERTESEQVGTGGVVQMGMEYKGLGAYANSAEISSDDLQYLSGLLQAYLYLAGVNVVPPSEAEVDVYITVDVFGTVRTRIDWFLANNEILQAKTALEVLAIDHLNGKLLMAPRSASAEVEYNEQYILWAGPISIRKTLKKGDPLLCDFTDLTAGPKSLAEPVEQEGPIPYPFRKEVEEWRSEK